MNNSRKNIILLSLALLAIHVAVYLNHFDNQFHFDDAHTIVNNGYITDISNIPLIFQDARTTSSLPTNQAYRPIITSLNAIDYWIADGLNPVVFHVHIYVEFIVLLILLFLMFSTIFKSASGERHELLALFGVALFAFHTATAETLNYIISRSDGFSTFMVLLSMFIFMKASGWKKQLALLPFLVGCLAKPTALMLAPLLVLYSLLFESNLQSGNRKIVDFKPAIWLTVKSTWSFFIAGGAMYIFTRSMFSDTWAPGGNYSILEYLNTQAYVIWIYVKTFALPFGLTADTDLKVIKDLFAPKVLWGLFVIFTMLIVAGFSAFRRETLPISFGILWFFVALIPSSSIVPLAEVMNHHRTFFPYIGLVMATVWGAYLLLWVPVSQINSSSRKYALLILCWMLLSAHAYGTYQRNEVWDNDLTLWHDVTMKSPENGRGLMNYGLAEMRRGNMQKAIEYYQRAQETDYGRHPYLFVNLAIATNALSDRSGDSKLKIEAEEHFKSALALGGTRFPAPHYRFADWLHKNNRSSEALSYVKKALELSPAHKSASKLLEDIGAAAEEELAVIKENSEKLNTPEAYVNLSLRYYNLGQYQNCIEASKRALSLRPDYAPAFNNICTAFNMLGDFNRAIEACESALAIDPDNKLARGNLNWAKSQ